MLDIKWIRDREEEVQLAADRKHIALSVKALLELDDRKRRLLAEVEELRRQRNERSKQVEALMRSGAREAAEEAQAAIARAKAEQAAAEADLREAERQLGEMLLRVPNTVSPDTPDGDSDADNVELRRVGEPAAFDFAYRDHVSLCELHGMLDLARGAKTAGSRHYYLKGTGALLHRAVQQLAVDMLLRKGFTLMDVPLIVRGEALTGAGFFPLGQDQVYRLDEEDLWLVGTSEASLVSYCANEVLDLAQPLRLAAASTCFRSEIGSAGRDVHGLYRVHQFAKVEQVVVCEADPAVSDAMLHEITAHAEELLQLLELPYRVVAVCAGDMSQKTFKQFDIETWMPSRGAYGETHSASNLHDFQARRSRIRYRTPEGKLAYAHTLNNTMVATPRILIPLLEIHQEADGSIRIPTALQPYLNGLERIATPKDDFVIPGIVE
ncbi:serine--tRNA ligase [Cohnella nanjingensis]|uniref:Serine--tRNA ligase n=1 Tax=Cohnella nanjingensis TaxID=1387779 RepID=A0A7X0RVI7_9BACL|nr:serine--tRNA ligase [Cohnella nanjingensis]MBB6674376.1 serine--tRNA ligase [Cohnella nanjingensis]